MRFLRQSLVGVFLAAMTLGLLAFAGQMIGGAVQDRMGKENRARPTKERVFAVNVVRAEIGIETPVLASFGEVKSRRTLELRSASGGRVIELSEQFVDGGEVSAGDVLVRIDPSNAQSTLSRVQADIADAQADARDAQRSLALAQDEQIAAQDQADLRAKALQGPLGEQHNECNPLQGQHQQLRSRYKIIIVLVPIFNCIVPGVGHAPRDYTWP